MSTSSIRDLRADLAAAVRRAGQGEATIVTVNGAPVAQLGPLDDRAPTLAALVASGSLLAPRRSSPWRPPDPVVLWAGTRLDRAVAEVRG